MTDTEARADLVARAADAGARVALASFREELTVETKADKTDVVTQIDRDAQRRVVETIREKYDEPVVGEEEGTSKAIPEKGPAWVVDPIDGTNNFVRGLRIWGTSVASVVDGEPVAAATVLPALADTYLTGAERVTLNGDPVRVSDREDSDAFVVDPILLDDTTDTAGVDVLAERFGDFRRLGCAQATLAAVASGSLDAAITTVRMHPWDTIAGAHMIRNAGGTVTDLDGEPWRHDSRGLVASNGAAHDEVLAAARRAAGE
ncbi:inositol monophosphatase family protein [Halococcus saccharolyticus]|uniref:fructose-bisphosphatase n=1 Tax=Halococcus saccharolyticus DSM 5350 TaxID=1227455 RepID=M0MKR0_9EURY|nr:inositol monophosphatase [Halococcus saccharolyticus]EMA46287.1 putative inositol-1(or 4)-monophosphatase / fructose-1,6-bisphosphatase [Halococcus saccharolyticus DSM 5350]